MMRLRWILPTLLLGLTTAARADQISTFEDLGVGANSSALQLGVGHGNQFASGGNSFNSEYSVNFGFEFVTGWVPSSLLNPSPLPTDAGADYNYLYQAIAGVGSGGSATYAVGAPSHFPDSVPNHPRSSFVNLAAGTDAISIDVTNTTYDFLSMKYGDSIGKQFEAGDFLRLTIEGYSGLSGSGSKIGEKDFNLATGTNIVADWQTVNLAALKGAASLVFGLESSDNSSAGFGPNTPAYFAADNLITRLRPVPEPAGWMLFVSGCGILGVIGRSRFGRGVGSDRNDGRGEVAR